MARKPVITPAVQKGPDFVGATPADMAQEEIRARNDLDATSENAHALAAQFGYEGALTVGAVEDEIRHYQRRTAEACFELGKRLLILKELTPHGEFQQRIDLLGIEYRSAARLMSIASKFCKSANLSLLKASSTQSKLLELLILDDSEIEALEAGKTVRGVDLDKIDTMSVRELKAALRDREADLEASRARVTAKETETERLTKELARAKKRIASATPDEEGAQLREEVSLFAFEAEATILGKLTPGFEALAAHADNNGCTHEEFMSGCLAQIERALIGLRDRFNVKAVPDGNEIPDWLRPGAEEKAAEQVQKDIAKAGKKAKA